MQSRLPATLIVLLSTAAAYGETPVRREWTIDGVTREALIAVPATAHTTACPVVFAFHGHGGNMRNVAQRFAYQTHWPQAIAVYMQGLNTPGILTDPEGKRPGWQKTLGDQNDRDLKFFDAVLESLKKDYRVDAQRIYATGHSNGGGFTYLLWGARGDVLSAVAPCAAGAHPQKNLSFKPKPAFHLAGEHDPLVRFEWQKQTIDKIRELNGCEAGQPWGEHCTLYPSKNGTPLVTYIHSGGHEFPADAPQAIVKFFQTFGQPRSDRSPASADTNAERATR